MSDKSICDELTASSWRSHCSKENYIVQFHELEIFAIVPSFMISVLAKKFNGGLTSKFFLFGHIEIINKYDTLLANGWSIDSFPSFSHLTIDRVLSLIGSCLRTEGERNILKVLIHLSTKQLKEIYTFTCTCRTWRHYILTLF